MTKLEQITKSCDLKLIETTTVFNIYAVDILNVGINKNSNLYKTLKSIKWSGDAKQGDDMVTVFVGAKGRSQHSSTELHIFKGVLTPGHVWYNSSYEFKLTNID